MLQFEPTSTDFFSILLKTLVKHFRLPEFKHHDAKEDAIACASICLRLHEASSTPESMEPRSEMYELKGMISGILADDEVNYKEAYELLYWFEDRPQIASQWKMLYKAIKEALEDYTLDSVEADMLKRALGTARDELVG